jgi:hypothetical protein
VPLEARPEEKLVGRKRKPAPPPLLDLPGMNEAERERSHLFRTAYREEYKGQLSNTDNILLELAAVERRNSGGAFRQAMSASIACVAPSLPRDWAAEGLTT